MNIPNSQIESWQNQGAQSASINSHTSIRTAIENITQEFNFEIFLQGSYKNHTNIRGDSDVDVVINIKEMFYHNLNEYEAKQVGIIPAAFTWHDYEKRIKYCLNEYYTQKPIRVGAKSIKIDFQNSSYVPADVVITTDYRFYTSLTHYIEGICLFNRTNNNLIVNYPKQHFDNGNSKSTRTDGNFRKYVRLIKNARNWILENYIPPSFNAPSYFIESLLYNCNDLLLKQTPEEFLRYAINMWEYNNETDQKCQNEISPLYGIDDTSWNHHNKVQFAAALRNLFGV